MKFTLTISDATAEQISEFLNRSRTTGEKSLEIITPYNSSVSNVVNADEDETLNTNAPAFDSTGLPWDERIHSANRGANSDGTWRKRRGVSSETVVVIENELRMRAMTNAAPIIQPPIQPASVEGIGPFAHTPGYYQVMQPEQFQQPVITQATNIAPLTQPVHVYDFMQFMTALSQKSTTGIIDIAYLSGLTTRTGQMIGKNLTAITDVNGDQNAINAAIAIMQQDGKW